jgi:hypothetical protein
VVLVRVVLAPFVGVEVGLQVTGDGLADFLVVVEGLIRVVLKVCELENVAGVLVDHTGVIVEIIPVLAVEHVHDL